MNKVKDCIHSLHLDFCLSNTHDLLLNRKLTDGDISWSFLCHITCSNVSWSLSLKPLYEVVQAGNRRGLWFQDSQKIQELVCHFLLRPMSKKKASGLEEYWKNVMCMPNNVGRQFFKGRHLQSAHQSCVNIDRGKQEMRGQDSRRASQVGESEHSDVVTERQTERMKARTLRTRH